MQVDLFDCLSSALKKAAAMRAENGERPCQLIVVGDFCQLPPVVTKDEKGIPIMAVADLLEVLER